MPGLAQKFIDVLYRSPRSAIHKYKRFGGYINYELMLWNRRRMQKASFNLPPVTSHADGLEIYFLTGKKYLYQTLYCIQSLVKVTNVKLKFILVDDGSFDKSIIARIKSQLPEAEIIIQDIIEENLNNILPEKSFANLRNKRKVYPHIKKLTDVHTLQGKAWKLVLDSDMLFWKEPKELIDWLKSPAAPLHMLDCKQSYGYTKQYMELLCGTKIPDLLNVGAIGLNSEKIDWDRLNTWVYALENQEGASYFLEQALTAMLIGESDSMVLQVDDYIVNPDTKTINGGLGTLHHYVDISKEGYFKQAWKTV